LYFLLNLPHLTVFRVEMSILRGSILGSVGLGDHFPYSVLYSLATWPCYSLERVLLNIHNCKYNYTRSQYRRP